MDERFTESAPVVMTIDIGNTAMKVSVFEGDRLLQSVAAPGCDPEAVRTLLMFHHVDGICYCCVGRDSAGIADCLEAEGEIPFLRLTAETPLPIGVEYASRPTLGLDRVAAAVGAAGGETPLLVVDAGTAVTSDLVADGSFLGGNIAPGISLRFKSLHEYTSRLPLVEPQGVVPELGFDTVTAIRAGVVGGLAHEIESISRSLSGRYPGLKVLLAGGDADTLLPILAELEVPCFVDHAVVGRGLARIFNYNRN